MWCAASCITLCCIDLLCTLSEFEFHHAMLSRCIALCLYCTVLSYAIHVPNVLSVKMIWHLTRYQHTHTHTHTHTHRCVCVWPTCRSSLSFLILSIHHPLPSFQRRKIVFVQLNSPFQIWRMYSFYRKKVLSNSQLNMNIIFLSTKMAAENNDSQWIFVKYTSRKFWNVLF